MSKIFGTYPHQIILDEIDGYVWDDSFNRWDKTMRTMLLPSGDPVFKAYGSYRNKFAPVAPYHIYRSFLMNGYHPSTVLLLAHDVVAHADAYRETFEHPHWQDATIIMDNSVVELGKAVDTKMVKDAVDITGADVVVLPDMMNDAQLTMHETFRVWDEWQWIFAEKKKMVLLQGDNIRSWLECAEAFVELNPDWIGIPRCMEGIEGTHRAQFVDWAEMLFPRHPIHLFGFSDYIYHDIEAARKESVRSIDSAAPLRLPSADRILSAKIGPRGDWWETCEYHSTMIEVCKKINQLIEA